MKGELRTSVTTLTPLSMMTRSEGPWVESMKNRHPSSPCPLETRRKFGPPQPILLSSLSALADIITMCDSPSRCDSNPDSCFTGLEMNPSRFFTFFIDNKERFR